MLIGCGLRRAEIVTFRIEDLQLREDHWIMADLGWQRRSRPNGSRAGVGKVDRGCLVEVGKPGEWHPVPFCCQDREGLG